MENYIVENFQEVSWSEVNKAESEASSLQDMCSWAEAD